MPGHGAASSAPCLLNYIHADPTRTHPFIPCTNRGPQLIALPLRTLSITRCQLTHPPDRLRVAAQDIGVALTAL